MEFLLARWAAPGGSVETSICPEIQNPFYTIRFESNLFHDLESLKTDKFYLVIKDVDGGWGWGKEGLRGF
jgi:hypothetical protein